MIRVTGKVGKPIIANAIQEYNDAIVYAYCDSCPEISDVYYWDSNKDTLEEFCLQIVYDLIVRVEDNDGLPLPMIVIYTNASDENDIKVLEAYAKFSYEFEGRVDNVVLMTQK